MRSLNYIGLACVVVIGSVTSVQAQYPNTHQGFYASVGLGYGFAKSACDQCGDSERVGNLTGFMNIGGAISQSFLLGVEVMGWSKITDDNDNRAAGAVNGVVTWYPSPREGFFIKGGVGVGYLRGDQDTDQGPLFLSKAGVGYQLGLGYEVRIQRDLSVTAVTNFYGGNVGDIGALRNVTFNVLQFMAAVTFH